MSSGDEGSAAETIARTTSKLRALCNGGLAYAKNPYQVETFEQMLGLCAELTALVDARPLPEIERRFFEERRFLTPYPVVDTAVFDDRGRILLIQRRDSGRWALPGGWCEVGELPSENAVREVWEETGYRIALSGFLGVFDNIFHGGGPPHFYCLLFAGRVIGGTPIVTRETLDVRWFTADEAPWEQLHKAHPARIRFAFEWLADSSLPAFYDAPQREPEPTWQHDAGPDAGQDAGPEEVA